MNKDELSDLFEKMRCDLRSDIKTNIEQQTNVLKNAISDLREQQDKQYQDLKAENENLQLALEKQKGIISAMNRLNNVIIYGIPEDPKENRNSLVNKIKILCIENLKTTISNSDINWARRLGKPQTKPRPILLSLTTNLKKWQILECGPNLKGSDLFLSDDLAPEERLRRKYLNNVRKVEIRNGAKCQWKNRNLVINGELKSFEDLKKKYGDHVPVPPTEDPLEENSPLENEESARKRKREVSTKHTKPKTNRFQGNLDNFFRARADSLPSMPTTNNATNNEK